MARSKKSRKIAMARRLSAASQPLFHQRLSSALVQLSNSLQDAQEEIEEMTAEIAALRAVETAAPFKSRRKS